MTNLHLTWLLVTIRSRLLLRLNVPAQVTQAHYQSLEQHKISLHGLPVFPVGKETKGYTKVDSFPFWHQAVRDCFFHA